MPFSNPDDRRVHAQVGDKRLQPRLRPVAYEVGSFALIDIIEIFEFVHHDVHEGPYNRGSG
jgi:hypothetical protein